MPQEDIVLSGRREIYRFVASRGRAGATDEEIEAGTGIPGNTVRARRIELVRAKAIKKLPARQKRLTQAGRKAAVWVATGYFVDAVDDMPDGEDERRLHELRLVVNRRVSQMSEVEATIMAVLADCADTQGPEVGKSLLEAMAPLGLKLPDNESRASYLLAVLIQWAFARQDQITTERNALWALLADIEMLPEAFPKNAAQAVAVARDLAQRRHHVCDVSAAEADAAAQWLEDSL